MSGTKTVSRSKPCKGKGVTRSKSGRCRTLKKCKPGYARSRASSQCYSKAKKAKAYRKSKKSKSKSKSKSR